MIAPSSVSSTSLKSQSSINATPDIHYSIPQSDIEINHGISSFHIFNNKCSLCIGIGQCYRSFCFQLLSGFWRNMGRWARQDTEQRRPSQSFPWQSLWLRLSVQKRISLWQHRYATQTCTWKLCRHCHCLLCK